MTENLREQMLKVINRALETPIRIAWNGEVSDLKLTNLEALQTAVGGYIETVLVKWDFEDGINPLVLVVNEEGRLKDLHGNLIASFIARQWIVGPVVLLEKRLMR